MTHPKWGDRLCATHSWAVGLACMGSSPRVLFEGWRGTSEAWLISTVPSETTQKTARFRRRHASNASDAWDAGHGAAFQAVGSESAESSLAKAFNVWSPSLLFEEFESLFSELHQFLDFCSDVRF